MPAADPVQCFDALWACYRTPMHSFLLGRTGDADTARDLVQEVFLRAWRRIDELDGMAEQSRRAWLYAVARNLVTDHYRAAATRAQTGVSLQAAAAGARTGPVDPAGLVETADEVGLVGAAVRALPAEQRLILTMHAVGEMTSSQIGEALNQPAGTIRYKLSTARRALAEALSVTQAESIRSEATV